MLKVFIAAIVLSSAIQVSNSQIDDIFNKTKEKIEEEIEKEKKKQEKEEKERKEKEKKEKEQKDKEAKGPNNKDRSDTSPDGSRKSLNPGRISFTREKDPDLKKGDPRAISEFNFKDIITACISLNAPFGEYPLYELPTQSEPSKQEYPTGDYYIKYFINFEPSAFVPTGVFMGDEISSKAQSLLLYCEDCTGDAEIFEQQLKELPGGKHINKIELWKGNPAGLTGREPVASGEFTLYKPVLKKFSEVPAGMNNNSLEQDALTAINRYAQQEGWKERYSKATITSYDWVIERNEWTGIIICRKLYLTMLGTWPDGSCRYAEFGVRQDHDGSRYSNVMYYNSIGGMWECECE